MYKMREKQRYTIKYTQIEKGYVQVIADSEAEAKREFNKKMPYDFDGECDKPIIEIDECYEGL